MRKWNHNLTLAENLVVGAKQPAVRLNLAVAGGWALLWIVLTSLAYAHFDERTFYASFLLGPLAALAGAALVGSLALASFPVGRAVALKQSVAASERGMIKWAPAAPLLLAALPFAPGIDVSWTAWVEPALGAYAGARLAIAVAMLRGRFA
ncbi:MAG: hypothetical protein ACREEW_13900 [Caulobacteraceae bacterium]